MPDLSLTEWGRGALSPADVAASGLSAEALAARLDGLVELRAVWAGGADVRAAGTVGALAVGGLRVTVQPRLAAGELATMIRYAWSRDVAGGQASARMDRDGLDELLGRLLADEAAALAQRGVARRYERRQERLGTLRGRPVFTASFPLDAAHATTLVCAHHLLTADNPLNRIVRAALDRSATLDVSARTRRDLAAQRALWQHVAAASSPSPADVAAAQQRSDRLTAHYALALRLADLVLRGARPSGLFETGHAAAGFRLNMAELFEAFVHRALDEWAAPHGLTVHAQSRDRSAFLDGEGRVYRQIIPDLVVSRAGTPVAVLDAKYKPYWRTRDAQGTPERKVSTADLYQLFFYAQRLQHQHGLAAPPAALVVAPAPADGASVAERFRRVAWHAGVDHASAAHLAFVPLARWLTSWTPSQRASHVDGVFGSLLVPATHL